MDQDPLANDHEAPRISTGSSGLDTILNGGLDKSRMYLYEGRPGSGKTTLALQFLLEGARIGERVLYVTLSETKRELDLVAHRHGWSLAGVDIFELVPAEATLDPERELTVLHPAEVELSETTKLIFDRVDAVNPTRVVFDSLSELRLLAQDPLRYRRQVLALKHFFAARDCTVILLDDLSSSEADLQLHSISHGVVLLEQLAIDFGAERRRLRVLKMRGIEFRGGYHDFTIRKGGLQIFPRLIAAEHQRSFTGDFALSGNKELDLMLGGGLERGTNTLLLGAAGVGKSSLALTYAIAAAERGEHAVYFAFDEGRGTLEARARTLSLPLDKWLDEGRLRFQQIDPAELSTGEFAANVRKSVEIDGARVVVIDSLNGYLNSIPEGRFLVLQMHELLTYLNQQGVLTLLVLAQHGLVGPMDTPLDISYLSDAVLMLRYFEYAGQVRRALSVVKKRSGDHEHTIREFRLAPHGISVGPPLTTFSGIFSGTPTYTGDSHPLMGIRTMKELESTSVAILAPIGRDGPASAELLRRAGLQAILCTSLEDLVANLDDRLAAVLLAEEALFGKDISALSTFVADQPPWSDLPFIVLTSHIKHAAVTEWRERLVHSLRNVSLHERPVQAITLTSAAQAAVRARLRQYEIRRLLEAQRQAANELERLVLARTRDLILANEELRTQMVERARIEESLRQVQKIEAIGQLTGGVAHDFNNLLMVILGGLEMLGRHDDSTRRQAIIDGMRHAAQRGSALTRQLLAFSRKQALQPQPIDLVRQLSGMRELLNRSLRGDVDVELRFSPDLWPVQADPAELELVILNLAVNARDAMPKGGTIKVHARNAPALEHGELSGDFVRLAVSDCGTGMSPDVKQRVFEPFFTTKEVGKGSGLGLAQVYGFAKQSGGDVEIETEVGYGTTVTLILPRAVEQPIALPEDDDVPVDERRRVLEDSILMVEDNEEVAGLVEEMLQELGYRVTRVASPAAALAELAEGRAFDVLFSDIMMPGEMDGVELGREIRLLRKNIPVLLTSAFAEANASRAEAEGFRVLAKPYRLDELAAALASARRDVPLNREETRTRVG